MNIYQQKASKLLDEKNLVYTKYKTDFDSIPALGNAMQQLNSINIKVAEIAALQLQNTTGITKHKLEMKSALAKFAYRISGALSSLASDTNNIILLNKSNFSIAALEALNDKLIGPTCNNIYDLALANLNDIAPYGITADLVNQFKADNDAYALLSAQPRKKINDRSAYTQKLKDLFNEAVQLEKNKIKKLLLGLEAVNVEAYNAFIAVKKQSHGDDKGTAPTPPAS